MFIASVEVKRLPGSKMGKGEQGALVYCLIPAESKNTAKQRLRTALEEDSYRLIRIELLEDYESFHWENAQDRVQYDALAKRAALNDDVVYGPFYTWKESA